MDTPIQSEVDATTLPVNNRSHWWFVAIGISSAVFSISLFFWQVAHRTDQATGKIVTIMDTSVMIVDIRGKVTMLTITPETTIHLSKLTTKPVEPGPPKNDINQLAIGQIVHTFGNALPDGQFISSDIRVMDRREPKIKK